MRCRDMINRANTANIHPSGIRAARTNLSSCAYSMESNLIIRYHACKRMFVDSATAISSASVYEVAKYMTIRDTSISFVYWV